MPKLYFYAGMYFYFFANDHKPIHLHVDHGAVRAKATLIPGLFGTSIRWKWLRGKLSPAQQVKAEKLLKRKAAEIEAKWEAFHERGEKPKFERIIRLK